ncbi:hypothetical protein [Micromonospora sp. DT227]|uniref:hypothetical protein n=1 Tax=Micromonospora sp. DT227 TaxID=3393433 RepID=UPI003CEF308A
MGTGLWRRHGRWMYRGGRPNRGLPGVERARGPAARRWARPPELVTLGVPGRRSALAPGARPTVPVDRHAPLADFVRVAAGIPVFWITSAEPVPGKAE